MKTSSPTRKTAQQEAAAHQETNRSRQGPGGSGALAGLAREVNSSPQVSQLLAFRSIAGSFVAGLQPGSPAAYGPVAQLLMSDDDFNEKMKITEEDDIGLRYIAVRLYLYHDLQKEKYQERLKGLRWLDDSIYQWLDQNKSPDPGANPRMAVMNELLKESEKEHEAIIREIQYAKTDNLPIDVTGLDKDTVLKVKEIWEGILTGKSNIKLQTGGKFGDKILPRIAKLLQTPFGRELIGELARPQEDPSRQIRIVPNLPKNIDEGKKGSFAKPIEEARLPRTVKEQIFGAPVIRDQHELVETDDDISPQEDYPVVNGPKQLNDAIMKGKTKGVTWGGKRYRFGGGQGSYVRIQESTGHNVDKDLNQIVTPGFVSLGHELGHALRILRGGSITSPDLYSKHARQFGLDESLDSLDKSVWSDLEEFVNINEVENRIRGESRMTLRSFHATKVTAIVNKRKMTVLLNQILDKVPMECQSYVQGPISEVYEQLFYKESWDFGDPGVVKKTENALRRWQEEMPALIQDAKLFNNLRERYYKLFNDNSGLHYEEKLADHKDILGAVKDADRVAKHGFFENKEAMKQMQIAVEFLEKSSELIAKIIA